jgi:hypothetical protein
VVVALTKMAPDDIREDNMLVGEGEPELARVVVGPPAKREEGNNLNPPRTPRAQCLAAHAPKRRRKAYGEAAEEDERPSGAGTGGREWRSGENIPLHVLRHGNFGQLEMKAGGGRRDQ